MSSSQSFDSTAELHTRACRAIYIGLIAFILFCNSVVIGLAVPLLIDSLTNKGPRIPFTHKKTKVPGYLVLVTVVSGITWTVSLVIFIVQLYVRRQTIKSWLQLELIHTGVMSALWISAVATVFAELGRGCGALELLQHAAGSDSVLGKATPTINERLTSCSKLTTLSLFVVLVCIIYIGIFFFTVIHALRSDWGEEGGWNVAKLEDGEDSD